MSLILPHLNAALNTSCTLLLIAGWFAIRQKQVDKHRICMGSAFACSVLFLISYLVRFYLTGTHPYPGEGWDRTIYLIILGTHTPLAAFVPILAICTIRLAMKGNFAAHRKWAKITLPIWLYVSVTGVLIYYMLYHYAAIGI